MQLPSSSPYGIVLQNLCMQGVTDDNAGRGAAGEVHRREDAGGCAIEAHTLAASEGDLSQCSGDGF